MTFQALVDKQFEGGMATDKKVGLKNSAANIECFDIRKSPSQMTVLPAARRADNNIVKDLIQNEVMTNTGTIYSLGSAGYIYSVSTTGVYSVAGNIRNGYFGLSYRQDQNSIYMTSDKTVSSITNLQSTPSINPDYYNISQSTYDNTSNTGFNVNTSQSGSTLLTAIGTTYIEGNTVQERFFQTDISPLNKIGVFIVSKGTGHWTLTLHDGLGTNLGTVTVLNAALVNNTFNYFVFPTQVNVSVAPAAQTYHFHVTSTVAGGSVSSSTTNDLSSADMQLWADRLIITNNGLHPMETFQQFELIGNGRYLSVWEPLGDPAPDNTEWQRHKLVFPPGYEVCGIAVFNEYAAIAVEATTTGTNSPQSGIIFYWDGLSDTYNYFTQIPEGSPQAIRTANNALYYVANGTEYVIGSVNATPQQVRKLPNSESTYTISNTTNKVYPYSGTVHNGVQLFAWPSVTTNSAIKMGVYSYGRVDINFPDSFVYSYTLSTDDSHWSSSNNLTIGMVKSFGDILHISWLDNGVYGVDVVDNTSAPAPRAVWESLIQDYGYVGKEKTAAYMTANWEPLPVGSYLMLKYKLDREADWHYSPQYASIASEEYLDGDGSVRFDIGDVNGAARFSEAQYGIEVYCPTATTPPVIIEISLVADNGSAETLQ